MTARVLIVDDDVEMCQMLEDGLRSRGYRVSSCHSADEAFNAVMADEVDVVVTDIRMRALNGLDLCARVVANRPDIPVVVMTAFGSLETAVATIRAGAFDFLTKPFDSDTVVLAIERAISHRSLREEVKRLRQATGETPQLAGLLGASQVMRQIASLVHRVSDAEASVLVTGESGTGKELVARALHELSRRRSGPFVAINCGAVPEPLFESELFGHAKGAFTDAKEKRAGLFVEAAGGTLFLDEVGETPAAMQVKLLRALETRMLRPVGSNVEIPFDVRIVAATNRDLESAVEERRFREDLLYRLNVIQIELPPLRARGGDILLLAQHFLVRFAERATKTIRGFSSAVADKLLAYAWPGNVRELQNCIERAVALAQFDQIGVDDLPEKIRDYKTARINIESNDPAELLPMEEVERRYILKVLEAVGGNKTLAAQVLGFDRRTLYRKLERVRDPAQPRGEHRASASDRPPAHADEPPKSHEHR